MLTFFKNVNLTSPNIRFLDVSFIAYFKNKKFELMLTRRTKAYSSSCSQTVSLSPAISSQFILGVCAAAVRPQKSIKHLILGVQVFQSHRCWYD